MRNIFAMIIACFFFSLSSCNSADNQLQEVLRESLETSNGVRTDLKIKFLKFEVKDILVSDSIAYYQTQYTTEKKSRTSVLENKIAYHQKEIAELEAKKRDIVDNMLLSDQKSLLETATKSLQSFESWTSDYLAKYDGRNESEVLAKLVTASFDFITLKGNKQNVTDEKFVLSSNGTKVIQLFVGRN